MKEKTVAKYPKLCTTIKSILLIFQSWCMVESGFIKMHYLRSKQRSTLKIDRSDLQLKFTNHQVNIADLLSVHQTTSFHYYYYCIFLESFHISFSWWSFTGVWVTASLLKSSGLFSVFLPFSIMLLFGWSPLVLQLPYPPVPLVILEFSVPKAPIMISIIVTFMCHGFFNSQARSRYLSFFSHSFSFIL